MRHDLLSGAISPAPRSVIEAPVAAALIAAPRLTTSRPAGLVATVSGAVDLAPVAVAADQDLLAAEGAEEEPAAGTVGDFPHVRDAAINPWTRSASGAIMPLQSCSRTGWGAAPS